MLDAIWKPAKIKQFLKSVLKLALTLLSITEIFVKPSGQVSPERTGKWVSLTENSVAVDCSFKICSYPTYIFKNEWSFVFKFTL